MKEVLTEVEDYLTEINFMWEFAHELSVLLIRTYKVQSLTLLDNMTENGPFLCFCYLYTNQDCPTTEEFQALAEQLQCFSFPLTCYVENNDHHNPQRLPYTSLVVRIDYGFKGLN